MMFQVALLGVVNALENFTAAVEVDISDERSLKAVEAFYTSQGFTVDYVDYANGLIRATKDGQRLSVKVSNYSGLVNGYLLVTVKAA